MFFRVEYSGFTVFQGPFLTWELTCQLTLHFDKSRIHVVISRETNNKIITFKQIYWKIT